jgi:hypothetical protein
MSAERKHARGFCQGSAGAPQAPTAYPDQQRNSAKCFDLLASPARFERTTPGLGILCSILLSYGDLANDYTYTSWARASPFHGRHPRIGASR